MQARLRFPSDCSGRNVYEDTLDMWVGKRGYHTGRAKWLLDELFSAQGFSQYLPTLDFLLLVISLCLEDFKGQLFQGMKSYWLDTKPETTAQNTVLGLTHASLTAHLPLPVQTDSVPKHKNQHVFWNMLLPIKLRAMHTGPSVLCYLLMLCQL